MHKVIQHRAYVHPLLQGGFERRILVDLNAVLMEVEWSTNQGRSLIVLELAERPCDWFILPIAECTLLVQRIEIRRKDTFDFTKVQNLLIVLIWLRSFGLCHWLGMPLLR